MVAFRAFASAIPGLDIAAINTGNELYLSDCPVSDGLLLLKKILAFRIH